MPRDVATFGGEEEGNRGGDFLGLGGPTDGNFCQRLPEPFLSEGVSIGVWTTPGATPFTAMPEGASSRARERTKACTAPLAAA